MIRKIRRLWVDHILLHVCFIYLEYPIIKFCICSGTFRRWPAIFSSHPFHMIYVHQSTLHLHLIFRLTQSSGHFSWVQLVQLMEAIFILHNCPSSMHVTCHNRKGFLSQNCLFCCSFDMFFTYALTGWEGSASDTCLWENATGLHIPEGCFYQQMQDFCIVKNCLCLIEVFIII